MLLLSTGFKNDQKWLKNKNHTLPVEIPGIDHNTWFKTHCSHIHSRWILRKPIGRGAGREPESHLDITTWRIVLRWRHQHRNKLWRKIGIHSRQDSGKDGSDHQGVNFTNIFGAAFFIQVFWAAFLYLQFGLVIFEQKVQKLLVKFWWNWRKSIEEDIFKKRVAHPCSHASKKRSL